MHITLAPMEGVVDYLTREVLTEAGGLDHCVTEFVRVTDTPLPSSAFYRLCPELYHDCQTRNQIPVTIQLLGSNPEMMAQSAVQAVSLGATSIDINFGCPAKTVNKHRGGAVLLQEPALIHRIVSAIRQALPEAIPVTAKIRLGYHDKSLAIDNAQAIEAAGATALTVHARTKSEGYRPPAHWEWIAKINESITLPVIANGDIWTVNDAKNIQSISECQRIMIGRGILRNPLLAWQIKSGLDSVSPDEQWQAALSILHQFADKASGSNHRTERAHPYFITDTNRYIIGRIKQWLGMMSKGSEQALMLFQVIKRLNCSQTIIKELTACSPENTYG